MQMCRTCFIASGLKQVSGPSMWYMWYAELDCSPCWASAAALLPALTEFAVVW